MPSKFVYEEDEEAWWMLFFVYQRKPSLASFRAEYLVTSTFSAFHRALAWHYCLAPRSKERNRRIPINNNYMANQIRGDCSTASPKWVFLRNPGNVTTYQKIFRIKDCWLRGRCLWLINSSQVYKYTFPVGIKRSEKKQNHKSFDWDQQQLGAVWECTTWDSITKFTIKEGGHAACEWTRTSRTTATTKACTTRATRAAATASWSGLMAPTRRASLKCCAECNATTTTPTAAFFNRFLSLRCAKWFQLLSNEP